MKQLRGLCQKAWIRYKHAVGINAPSEQDYIDRCTGDIAIIPETEVQAQAWKDDDKNMDELRILCQKAWVHYRRAIATEAPPMQDFIRLCTGDTLIIPEME